MPRKKLDTFSFNCASAGWRTGVLAVNGVVDRFDRFEPFSRFCWYVDEDPPGEQWGDQAFDFYIQAIAHYQRPNATRRRFCVLSAEGDVAFSDPDYPAIEHICGAGIYANGARGLGRLFGLSEVGDCLFAYGECGQLYKRHGDDDWRVLDPVLEQDPRWLPIAKHNIIYDVRGPTADDLYISNDLGELYHWNGETSRLLLTAPAALTSIHVDSADEIWVCGDRGVLLSGNARDGFKQAPGVSQECNFTGMTRYRGELYLASIGAFTYVDGLLSELVTGLEPDAEDAHSVATFADDLWIVGEKDILYFDGARWKRVDFPGNDPIR